MNENPYELIREWIRINTLIIGTLDVTRPEFAALKAAEKGALHALDLLETQSDNDELEPG